MLAGYDAAERRLLMRVLGPIAIVAWVVYLLVKVIIPNLSRIWGL